MSRNGKLFTILAFIIVGMATFGYANERLFNLFCEAIGINLSPDAKGIVVDPTKIDENRKVKVVFTTETNRDVPALFDVEERMYDIVLGKVYENQYLFKNRSKDTLYVRPIHSVFPTSAANKYKMMECFCYDDVILFPREEKKMKLSFFFNTDVDPKVNRIVMHYALVKRDKDEVIAAGKE